MLYNTRNPHGGEVYSRPVALDFSANINPYGMPPEVAEAVRQSVPLLSQYPDPYCRELVHAIAQHENVPEGMILCGNGAADLIFALCAAEKPRRALLPVPSFSEYRSGLDAAGCEAEFFFLRESDDFALTQDFLPALERFTGEMLMLCNPNNPTGQVICRPLMEQILQICREKHIFLFVDECFLDLTDGGDALSLKDQLSSCENLLLLKAFTKSYGMAGLRLGYCLCGNPMLLERMGQMSQAWNVSIPAQAAGVAALKQQRFLKQAAAVIQKQRPVMTEALRKMGMKVIPSQTNFLLFYSEKELREPLQERGILIRSCANYPGLTQGWYRVAVKLPEQNEKLILAMEEIVNG